jgi:CheY-like chemotaxis protein/HPt (histidine-containing phosphotransfer) domain-containing protein
LRRAPQEVPEAELQPDTAAAEDHDFSGFHVLIVDDHPVNILFARKQLKRMGFVDIDEAVNGLDALTRISAAADNPYDIVLLDCQMPELDGFETCRRLRAAEAGTDRRMPVVAMTANAMEGDRDLCLKAGMDDYISKPVNPARLHDVLRRLLFRVGGASVVETADASASPEAVNIAQMDLFTDGDLEQEKMLAKVFLGVGESCIDIFRSHLAGRLAADEWRMAAHKLKGSAAQLGANRLSAICLQAEQRKDASSGEKASMLSDIEGFFEEVRVFFSRRHGVTVS